MVGDLTEFDLLYEQDPGRMKGMKVVYGFNTFPYC